MDSGAYCHMQAGFLKSSPKITLYPKPLKQLTRSNPSAPSTATTPLDRRGSPAPAAPPSLSATWVCPICSFSNPVPSNFDPATANARTPLPPCLACGIKPPLVHVVKAAISALSNRPASGPPPAYNEGNPQSSSPSAPSSTHQGSTSCPRCTFQNHPSLSTCEMCGAPLSSPLPLQDKRLDALLLQPPDQDPTRSASPGPSLATPPKDDAIHSIKFSFRGGGEKIFYERLKNALVQRKWLLQSAPPIPKPQRPASGSFDAFNSSSPGGGGGAAGAGAGPVSDVQQQPPPPPKKAIGIAGLERRGLEQRQNNEAMLGSAFADLDALMTSAKEIITLAEQFSSQANLGASGGGPAQEASSALGLVTTRDMLGSGSASENLYVSELSRNLAEWLTDDTRGVLRREGGIVTLVDLWAVFNRARGGVELVSPADFEKAARLWDTLKLPVRLRQFKSGLLVVQGRDRTDEKTVASLLAWLKGTHEETGRGGVSWDVGAFGRGVTAQETAERFGWSVGVATEELEMAEEAGALCREQGLDGIRFWENWLVKIPFHASVT